MTSNQPRMKAVELRDVCKSFRLGRSKIAAVQHVNLTVGSGELVAIVGPSGSGKTTLAHIIGGLTKADSGEVVVNGQDLRRRNDRALSRYRNHQTGFVFQTFGLLPYYTALENVAMPLIVAGVSRRQRKQRALECLKLVGLEQQARQRVDTLSGGQRQRVSIARALVQQPNLIIADEPTGSLDTARGEEIMHLLEQLNHRQGITVIMVTHDTHLATQADRIIEIRDGQIPMPTQSSGHNLTANAPPSPKMLRGVA